MNKTYKLTALWMMCLMLLNSLSFTACDDGDDENTNQYTGGINLNVFGPCPVARGGVLRFLGSGMDQVTGVIIPGCDEIKEIEVISNEEIRVTVPQTAEVGLVRLNTPKGDISTKTEITYSEPIDLESISPASIKPGSVLTIKGEYLNLIKEVIFANDVVITEFQSQSRNEIKVKVPSTAQTGKVIISDGAEIPNWIYSDVELQVILPAVAEIADLSEKKPGDEVTIEGTDFDLITKVTMPNGDEVEYTVADNKLTFTLPENISGGNITVYPESGVKVVIATIGVAIPSDVVAEPATELRGGSIITLTGKNMELITNITFPGVTDAVALDAQTETEVKVTMPAAAISGDMKLNTNSGVSVPVAIVTQKPEFESFASDAVALASNVTIKGKNMDLVVKVTYTGGAEVEVTPQSANEITFAMPSAGVETGALTLTMANGENVTTSSSLTINAPVCCYISVLPEEGAEIKGGTVLQVTVENGDLLTEVQVDGQTVQHILIGNQLYISIPQLANENSIFKLISSNGFIEHQIACIPATEIENVIMNEMRDLGSWAGEDAGGAFRLYKTDLTNAGFAPGSKLRFYVSAYAGTQIQINDAKWGTITMPEYKADECPKIVEVEVTQEFYDKVMDTNDGWSDTGIVVQGAGCIISKVTVWYEISLNTYIWKGTCGPTNWAGDCIATITPEGDALLKPGKTLGIDFTCDPSQTYWQVEFMGSWWTQLPSFQTPEGERKIWDFAATDTNIEITLTQADIDIIVNQDMLFCGNGVVITGIYVR